MLYVKHSQTLEQEDFRALVLSKYFGIIQRQEITCNQFLLDGFLMRKIYFQTQAVLIVIVLVSGKLHGNCY